ncbi:MAG: helix-turn-helix domain-containing protein [Nanoarchaeota archaeon]
MGSIEDKVTEAKAEVEGAKLNLLGAYLSKIQAVYTRISPEQKDDFLANLEKIVIKLEQNPLPKPGLYDTSKGREIRKGLGLSKKELAEFIGVQNRMLYRYENGEVSPRPTNKVGQKYLAWLKDQGYNPYNL